MKKIVGTLSKHCNFKLIVLLMETAYGSIIHFTGIEEKREKMNLLANINLLKSQRCKILIKVSFLSSLNLTPVQIFNLLYLIYSLVPFTLN